MVCTCGETTIDSYLDDCPYLTTAYILAGLSMMLNIRLAYSSAPYALIRFRLPENLFSVFVRRMASALEFWCLPSMLLGNIMEIAQKVTADKKSEFKLDHSKQQQQDQGDNKTKLGTLIQMKRWKFMWIIFPSMVTMWSDFITYLILLIVYVTGGDTGNVTGYYFVIAVSGFIFGINMVLVYAADWRYTPVYIAGENAFPMLTSIIHYFATLIFGNRRRYNSDFMIVTIDICVAIVISFTTATLWTSAYYIMDHKSPNKILRFGVRPGQFGTADAYGTTRNTDLTFSVNLNGGTGFQSSGTIIITVGSDNFTELNSHTGDVTITLSGSGSIKKSDGEFARGINEPLNKGTQLVINATGRISTPNINGSDITIKGNLTVTSEGGKKLGTSLTLGPDSSDPSSNGLGGSITTEGTSNTVTIKENSTITLKDEALKAIKSLTQNAVTLSGTGGFKSSASITVSRDEGNNTDLSNLNVTSNLQITINDGSIRNSDGSELQRGTTLNKGTKLSIEANGQITEPRDASGTVKLTGTIVVTSNNVTIGNSGLNFNGGPNRTGVDGTLTLNDENGPPKYVKITNASSKITITSAAYTIIKKASDTIPSFFTIGAADPRNPEKVKHADGLDKEHDFTKHWHIMPSDKYDSNDLPDPTVVSPALMVIIGMGFVYCIYPGIAPGMIVPFFLVDKIETVLLVLTTFPPVIIAILQKHKAGWSPKTQHNGTRFGGWKSYNAFGDYNTTFYHGFDILMIIKMTLLVIFIYCLHYRDSHISRSIVNQPKMSTFLTIVFYMCHEFLLALGFSGVIGNNGATYIVLPAQYVGALLMIFLAFYSEGYIIEYKSHDPAH
ncbi:Tpr-related protein family member, putative [Theileria annulata]|uniref:Tpr-related protein family member, putative n=1 Tax=Theileria annulata TaxID=5874 RepID=Q4UHQ3_THEAN|nr:Tpr-related protein family member, putative [Theileria annulata]CAI73386.1 Tpr-related protein family member, putative [Theileria annulata]|eukprot:XP_954063.1 Tpr-related protein family member, putative [Theileria annulata]